MVIRKVDSQQVVVIEECAFCSKDVGLAARFVTNEGAPLSHSGHLIYLCYEIAKQILSSKERDLDVKIANIEAPVVKLELNEDGTAHELIKQLGQTKKIEDCDYQFIQAGDSDSILKLANILADSFIEHVVIKGEKSFDKKEWIELRDCYLNSRLPKVEPEKEHWGSWLAGYYRCYKRLGTGEKTAIFVGASLAAAMAWQNMWEGSSSPQRRPRGKRRL